MWGSPGCHLGTIWEPFGDHLDLQTLQSDAGTAHQGVGRKHGGFLGFGGGWLLCFKGSFVQVIAELVAELVAKLVAEFGQTFGQMFGQTFGQTLVQTFGIGTQLIAHVSGTTWAIDCAKRLTKRLTKRCPK